jgi:hypothetical protein
MREGTRRRSEALAKPKRPRENGPSRTAGRRNDILFGQNRFWSRDPARAGGARGYAGVGFAERPRPVRCAGSAIRPLFSMPFVLRPLSGTLAANLFRQTRFLSRSRPWAHARPEVGTRTNARSRSARSDAGSGSDAWVRAHARSGSDAWVRAHARTRTDAGIGWDAWTWVLRRFRRGARAHSARSVCAS